MRCYPLVTVFLTGFWLVAISCFAAEDALPNISANDNRVPAGRLEAGVLTLHLELRKGLWRPEAPDGRDQAASVERTGDRPEPSVACMSLRTFQPTGR
jgi:hypothetical protein